jgi:hypothetical protein
LQAMYNIFATPTPPTLVELETINLPQGIQMDAPQPVRVVRNFFPTNQIYSCALLAFKTPFARTYMNTGCNSSSFDSNDDYQKIINYATNSSGYPTSTDSYMVITLRNPEGTKNRKVLIRGVTGVICPTLDGVTCSP